MVKNINVKRNNTMNNPNSKQWSSATPGYIIFLVDQSGSMNETYADGKTRAEFTSLVINRIINEIIIANSDGDKVKDRTFISMIGYGVSVEDVRSDYLSKYADTPLRTEKIKKKVSDGGGGLVEIEEQMPIFIEPKADGLTPMVEALSFAKELIDGWLSKKPENPAPVIINISDGLPFTGETVEIEMNKAVSISKDIMNINSEDGNPLIFNCHIGNGGRECQFEENESNLSDEQAKFLFNISSKVPESYKEAALKHDFKVKENSRGFVSNAKAEVLIKFIDFGSSGRGADIIA